MTIALLVVLAGAVGAALLIAAVALNALLRARQQDHDVFGAFVEAAREDRQLLVHALVARSPQEYAAVTRAAQAGDIAAATMLTNRRAVAFDDDYVDPDTHERVVPVGMM